MSDEKKSNESDANLSSKVNRREILKKAAQGMVGLSLLRPAFALTGVPSKKFWNPPNPPTPSLDSYTPIIGVRGRNISPIAADRGDIAEKIFTGDSFAPPHKIVRNVADHVEGMHDKRSPAPSEEVPLVIVGGGVSGLMSAYLLRQHKPIVLEQDFRMGGNAKGERWGDIHYSIGAAYMRGQAPGHPLSKIYQELNLNSHMVVKKDLDPTVVGEQRYYDFWKGEFERDEHQAKKYLKLSKHLEDMANNRFGIHYPEIPPAPHDTKMRNYIGELNSMSFLSYLEKVVEGPLPDAMRRSVEHYCWSTFACSATELSAAHGLNEYAHEFLDSFVTPGGNSFVTDQLLRQTIESGVSLKNFRTESIVYRVQRVGNKVEVSYTTRDGATKTIAAKAVVMCCPKFICKHIVSDLDQERKEQIDKLKYHSYLVSNVLINKRLEENFYDMYLLGKSGHLPMEKDLETDAERQKITDIILSRYAQMKTEKEGTVLTLYRGLPYDGARSWIVEDGAFDRVHAETKEQLEKEILPLLNLSRKNVVDIRLTRWGHPLPIGTKNLIKDGVCDLLRKPFQERIFFVEQDNWMQPFFETGAMEAIHFSKQIHDLIA